MIDASRTGNFQSALGSWSFPGALRISGEPRGAARTSADRQQPDAIARIFNQDQRARFERLSPLGEYGLESRHGRPGAGIRRFWARSPRPRGTASLPRGDRVDLVLG